MNKRSVLWLVVGVGLLVAGTILGLSRGWDYSPGDDDLVDLGRFAPSQVSSLRVETGSVELRFYDSAADALEISAVGAAARRVTVSLDDGVLTLREKERSFFPDFFRSSGYVVFWFPGGTFSGDISAVTDSGELSVSGLRLSGSALSAKSGSGDVSVYDVEAAALNAEASSGAVYLGSVSVSGTITAAAASGHLSLYDAGCSQAELRSDSGGISVSDARGDSLRVSSSSGDISLYSGAFLSVDVSAVSGGVSALTVDAADLSVQTASGSVDLSLPGEASDYTVRFDTASGSLRGQTDGGGEKTVRVETASGGLSVRYEAGD